MKRRNLLQTVFAAVLAAAVLTACGSSKGAGFASENSAAYMSAGTTAYDSGGDYMFSDAAAAPAEVYEAELAEEYDVTETGSDVTQVQQDALADRKLIKTVNLNVETEQFDVLVPAIEQRVTALGGYIEDMSSYNRGGNYSSDYIGTKYLRYANMTIRIPKDNLDTFLTVVAEQSNIISRSESVMDVTLQYVDLESHKKALIAEQDRLLELIEQAETVEDIITIEGRLSEVRYQLESMESQLRTFDNKINYSTVYLYIDEVERYTPTETTTVWQRIGSGFMESLSGVGRGISNFIIWFIVHIPYIVVWAVSIVAAFLIVRAVCKAIAKRRAKKRGMQMNPYQAQDGYQPQNVQPEQAKDGNSAENDNTNDKPTES